jgi:hypothetical protein
MGVIEQRLIVIVFFILVEFRRLKRRQFWRWLDLVVRYRSHG